MRGSLRLVAVPGRWISRVAAIFDHISLEQRRRYEGRNLGLGRRSWSFRWTNERSIGITTIRNSWVI